ncbi:MAG: M24 family metallopeptidase [Rhizobiaceae bacterium]
MTFAVTEFQARVKKAQMLMDGAELDALLVTTHPDVFYFTGFLTRFWESPTRPWFLVVPRSGDPVAVIPGIGETLMRSTWVEDIRTWSAPDLQDDGVSLLADTLKEIVGSGKVGIPDGHETHLRMPLEDFNRLKSMQGVPVITGDRGILRALRMLKSPNEITRIRSACEIAGRAFDRVHEFAQPGVPLETVFRKFQITCLEEGADWVPYLAGGAGSDGYADVISPATSTPLQNGNVLMLDTGLVHGGYFCDYDRNFAIGHASNSVVDAHRKLIEATAAGFEAAKPGARACDLFYVMDKVLAGGEGRNDNGRLGHGLGIQLTEWPSLIPADKTVLEEGMVLTLEPGVETSRGNMLVHEENIVVTKNGAEYLSNPSGAEIRSV